MVVVGSRHVVTSSALPSKTKPLQHTQERQQQNGDARVAKDGFSVDMRELRTSSAVQERSLVTELKQMKEYVRVNKSSTTLKSPPTAYAFVYGTLKKGFSNYWLMEEVCATGHARFLGSARTKQKFPMVCGPYQVPFLIDIPSEGHHVRGELYEVDRVAIDRLDELEGVSKGNYVRRSVVLSDLQLQPSVEHEFTSPDLLAQAYFAAPSYASKIAEAPHIEAFTEKEMATYVRRKDRPQNRTFLQHIDHWIKTKESARSN
ncbi:hypothetical protein KC19_9G126900 [Ceratodon purpureus]|uniref:Gamma-glutamylcyclotransferase family protein n=1 Tax=Ceratodon purpureus TaxID=3225 RepID=A0A8T0GVP9_CERPU|nr:hypothetical protein KC19_9G126900 [Ceratodon purpureus]